MNIPFIYLHSKAIIPSRATPGSAGWDVTATSMTVDHIANTVTYGIGLATRLAKGTYMDARARSGITKMEWMLANGAGVVDSDYRGEIFFVFRPTNPDIDVRNEFPYKIGDRIGQLILCKHQVQEYEEVDTLDETTRGSGKQGSTGR